MSGREVLGQYYLDLPKRRRFVENFVWRVLIRNYDPSRPGAIENLIDDVFSAYDAINYKIMYEIQELKEAVDDDAYEPVTEDEQEDGSDAA